MYRIKSIILFGLLILSFDVSITVAQPGPDPQAAFIRSLVVPGWGHYYVNHNQWRRGQVHLGTEIVLIASYFGFSIRADNLENQYETLASLKAGVNLSDRSRTFRLALGDFNTLLEYNDFQLRSRNWNRLFEEKPENQWVWQSEENRNEYNSLRSDVDRVKNQLPAILGLMIANRVISAVSAYNRAKSQTQGIDVTLMPISAQPESLGVLAQMNIRF